MKSLFFKPITLLGAALFLASCSPKSEPTPPESTETHEETVVTLTPEQLRNIEIKTERLAPGRLEILLKAPARVSENLNKTAKVTSAFEGRLTQLSRDLNDPVRAGEVLGLVQTPELLGRALELKAPLDGVVVERKGALGELVEKGAAVYTVSDPDALWLLAEVREEVIAAVREGQATTFSVPAYPGKTFTGRVARIGHRVKNDSRTVEVRVEIQKEARLLKPGMFAEAAIVTGVEENVRLIPESALQTDEAGPVVFVALEGNRFEKRPVKTGREQAGRVLILEGVQPGERVVTEGGFLLKSELLKHELGEE